VKFPAKERKKTSLQEKGKIVRFRWSLGRSGKKEKDDTLSTSPEKKRAPETGTGRRASSLEKKRERGLVAVRRGPRERGGHHLFQRETERLLTSRKKRLVGDVTGRLEKAAL